MLPLYELFSVHCIRHQQNIFCIHQSENKSSTKTYFCVADLFVKRPTKTRNAMRIIRFEKLKLSFQVFPFGKRTPLIILDSLGVNFLHIRNRLRESTVIQAVCERDGAFSMLVPWFSRFSIGVADRRRKSNQGEWNTAKGNDPYIFHRWSLEKQPFQTASTYI